MEREQAKVIDLAEIRRREELRANLIGLRNECDRRLAEMEKPKR